MRNPYTAAAWSYFHRAFHSVWGFCIVACLVASVLLAHLRTRHLGLPHSQRIPDFDLGLVCPFMVLIFILAWRGITSVLDAKARLLPAAARAHLVVLALLLGVVFIGEPALMYFYGFRPMTTLIAATWLLGAIAFYVIVQNSGIATLVMMSFFIFDPFRRVPRPFPLSSDTIAHASYFLIALSAAVVAFCFWRLWRMDEESRAYVAFSSGSIWRLRANSTQETNRPWANRKQTFWLSLVNGGSVDWAISAGRSRNILIRSLRWQAGGRPWYTETLFIAFLVGPQIVMVIWLRSHGGSQEIAFVPVIMASQMYLMFTVAQQTQLFRYRECDLLRPISREALLQEWGWGFALVLARSLSICLAISLLAVVICGASLAIFPSLAIALGLCSVFAFGATAWLARMRSAATTNAIVAVSSIPGGMLIAPLFTPALADYRSAALAGCVLLALVGIYLTRDAYRRWLLADLG